MTARHCPRHLLAACLLWIGLCLSGPASAAFEQSHSGFVNNTQCLGCHAEQAKDWAGSHHALAMQPARADTVLGDFNNRLFKAEGLQARFHRDGEHFLVTVTEGGKTETLTVAWTFGVHPLQQYLLAFPDGRWQAFPVAWDVDKKRWFHLQTGENLKPGDALHWRGRFFIANSFCIDCHTTGFRLGYDQASDHYQSTAAGSNVNCQACHGSGEAHLAWAQTANPKQTDKGFAKQPLKNRSTVMDVCGSCHARRHPISPQHAWAEPLLDAISPALLREDLYHADGQIQDEVFEYGSFVQSKMHAAGVTCLDCHNPHSLKPRLEGNALCSSCHEVPRNEFPTLKPGHYDTPAHHHHQPGTPGSACVDCHMPATPYMKIDPRRDHRFGIPRPDLTVSLGTPNACNQCHTEQEPAWAQQYIAQWFPQGRHTRPDHSQTIDAARRGDSRSLPALQRLAQDRQQPAIWRATALELLTRYPAPSGSFMLALRDPSPLVRATAVAGLQQAEATERHRLLTPLLRDPSRLVRLEAARVLADIPATQRSPADQQAFEQALQEYRLAQTALPDHPEGHANLGQLAWRQNNPQAAIRHFDMALQRDPHFIPAYQSLAVLHSQAGNNTRAIALLQQARLKALPEQQPEIDYALGLSLAEAQRLTEARQALQRVIESQPDNAHAHYNLGLLEQQAGKQAQAESHLLKALQQDDNDERSRYALALLYLEMKQSEKARPLLERLMQRYPQNAELRRHWRQIHRAQP